MCAEMIQLPFMGGYVKVQKGSRIKVYRQVNGSVRGFLMAFDDSKGLVVYEPDDYSLFDGGSSPETLSGKEIVVDIGNLKAFAFYPEVAVTNIAKCSFHDSFISQA